MKELIRTTGIDTFYSGQKLSSDILNSMNYSINELVNLINLYLKSFSNINVEEDDLEATYSVEEAINKIPKLRRSFGFKIKFREKPTGNWIELLYLGDSNTDEAWLDENNWKQNLKPIINGGEF